MIENSKKIVFTDSAKIRLEQLHLKIDEQITDYIKDRKNVPGDDFIEITASDIDEVSHRLRIIRPSKTMSIQLTIYLYATIGITTTFVGLFYRDIQQIAMEDHKRFIIMASGFILTVLSALLSFMTKIREKKNQDAINYERQKIKQNDFYSKYKER
jgi:hypothetical protein